MKHYRLLLVALIMFPLSLLANGSILECQNFYTISQGHLFHKSRMESRSDGHFRTLVKRMFNVDLSKKTDTRSSVEKFLDTREFKSWFANHAQAKDAFRQDLGIRDALVKHVNSPQEALLAKLMMIRQAKYTLDLTYYIFQNDESGYVILNELKEAIRRGVSVRFMYDSLGSLNPKSFNHAEFKALVEFAKTNAGFVKDKYGNETDQRARVEVVSFRSVRPTQLALGALRKSLRGFLSSVLILMGQRPIDTVFINPNHRSHDKMLIADQNFPELAIAIIGGRNIGNLYYGIPKISGDTFMDLEVIVKNNPSFLRSQNRNVITTDIASLYDLLYFHSGNRLASKSILSRFMNFGKQYARMETAAATVAEITKESQEVLGEDFASPEFGQRYLNEGFDKGGVDLTYTIDNVMRSARENPTEDNVNSKRRRRLNANHINKELEQYLSAEDKHIMIVSPYLWLSPEQITRLKRWIGADPSRKVTIITNSIITSDNMAAQTLVDATLGPQLVVNREYLTPEGETKTYGPEQIELFEYGRLDSVDIGGTKAYGKLHAKGAYMKALEASFVTTYNSDPRSQYLNSEMGLFIMSASHSEKVRLFLEQLVQDSHVWGSEEYHAIRTHPNLSKSKRWIAKNVDSLYKWLDRMRLVWLI